MEKNLISRAFELAPEATSLTELKRKLIRDGFHSHEVHQTLVGKLIRSQLTPLLEKSDKERKVR